MRICAVGCGAIANAMHGPAYAQYAAANPNAVLAACCDTDAQKAGAFKKTFGFHKAYTDADEMLDKESPGVVCVINPVELNAGMAEKVLQRGIPLLLEKPPGRTAAECISLIKLADEKRVPHRVAFNRRYAPLIITLKTELSARFAPSAIQFIRYDMFRVNRANEDFSTTAVHAVDTAKYLAGSDYKNARFTYRPYPQYGEKTADIPA